MVIAEFIVCLLLSLAASAVLSRRIEQLGAWLGLSELLIGLLTALGADAPEIATAISAIVGGHRDLGVSVVFGSNIFNLAGLLALSAVLTGQIRIRRGPLILNGLVGLAVTVFVIAMMMGRLSVMIASSLLAVVLLPYFALAALKPDTLRRIGMPWLVSQQVEEASREARRHEAPPKPSAIDMLSIIPSLAMIVLSSIGMVRSAVPLGARWNVPHIVIGTFVLASLTGIPNVVAALRLAFHGRGSAVLSETLNSNTFNLLVGVYLPTLLIRGEGSSRQGIVVAWWLLAFTAGTLVLVWSRRGLRRSGGLVLIAIYVIFFFATIYST